MGDRATAQMFFNNGAQSANDKTHPEYLQHAYQQFCSAVYADPTWATAAYQAGNNASDLKHYHAAVACWRRALECEMPDVNDHSITDAARAKVLCNLGWRLETVGQTKEALKCSLEATALDPKLAFAWLNLSIVQGRLGATQESVNSARKAFELSPQDSTIEMGLAFALLFNRNLAEGFKHFESRYNYRLRNFEKYPYPKGLGEHDKTVFLVSDQGIGDTLSMARFIRMTCKRARYVHACVHPELLRLFQYAFADVPNLNLLPQPCNFPAADAWTTFVSLPFALQLTDDEIRNTPQFEIKVPRTNAKQWKVPDRKLHIGIAWRGSAMNEINDYRSIPVTQFLDLYRVPGIQLYSLQVDANKTQLADTGCAPARWRCCRIWIWLSLSNRLLVTYVHWQRPRRGCRTATWAEIIALASMALTRFGRSTACSRKATIFVGNRCLTTSWRRFMSEISDDEFSVLLIAKQGQSMIPIGRWKSPVLNLAQKGLLQCVDSVNYIITPQGEAICDERDRDDDSQFRKILESSNKIANARTQAQQSVEQAALHLSFAAKASALATGRHTDEELKQWLKVAYERALELLNG